VKREHPERRARTIWEGMVWRMPVRRYHRKREKTQTAFAVWSENNEGDGEPRQVNASGSSSEQTYQCPLLDQAIALWSHFPPIRTALSSDGVPFECLCVHILLFLQREQSRDVCEDLRIGSCMHIGGLEP
jgi:hypothetical protein